MFAFVRGAILGCVCLLVVIQAYRPARTNPPVIQAQTLESAVHVPPAVEEILTRSCNDCHSNLTHWPWYSGVAPASWLIADDVAAGRRHLNFSEWVRPSVADSIAYTQQRFISVCRELRIGQMPLLAYTWIHPHTRLSPAQVQIVCQWAESGFPIKKE